MHQINHSRTIVSLDSVSFGYTKDEVVHQASFDIHAGDYIGIVGPNGGGKTTLLKLMLGLLTPHKGSIRLFGDTLSQFRQWEKIGYVPQYSRVTNQNFPITVEEVVMMGRYVTKGLFRMIDRTDRNAVEEALRQVDMHSFAKTRLSDLSGGQQQRVLIARALCAKPEIIFLDEPTAGVDAKTQAQFYALLRDLNQAMGLTLVLVSHELDIVAHEATELIYINRTIDYYGEPEAFLSGEYFHALIGRKGVHH